MKSPRIKKLLKKILSVLESLEHPWSPLLRHHQEIELSVSLCDDRQMRALNRTFRAKNKPTDVLSFPLLIEARKKTVQPGLMGDLVISLPTMIRQARMYRQPPNREFLRLAVHGLLHLLGHDHEKVPSSVARRMRSIEKKVLEELYPELDREAYASVKKRAGAPRLARRSRS